MFEIQTIHAHDVFVLTIRASRDDLVQLQAMIKAAMERENVGRTLEVNRHLEISIFCGDEEEEK